MPSDQTTRNLTLATPLGPKTLRLRALTGEERISGLFHFRLEMRSRESDIDFGQIVGRSVTVTMSLAGAVQRYVNGVVGRFVQGDGSADAAVYYADLYPSLWLLTMSSDCRIFQGRSVPEILEAVFEEHGLTDYRNALVGSYAQRDYCVQYNETAFDFVSRLMEEEGIFYFFEHQEGGHTLVLADDPSAFPAPGDSLSYGGSGSAGGGTVSECTLEESVIPGGSALDDFNFETPSTDLVTSADSSAARDGARRQLYEYPGGFDRAAAGQSLARIRVEEQDAPQIALRGSSGSPALVSGHAFTLTGHYRPDVDGAYVVNRLEHDADQSGYDSTFEALPAAVSYRPPRRTPKPVIAGTQTALVVGKAGEEIWTDKYGRVKVQFHWDRLGTADENSSCWVRVSHAWAGKSWGQLFLPRIGQEVIIGFEEGDPDRPIITGRVYNAEQTVPYPLPDQQTRSTIKSRSSKSGDGSNELRFEDRKGEEEIWLHAQRNLNVEVGNERTATVGGNRTTTVGGNETLTVGGERELRIEQGNDTLTVRGDRSLTIRRGDRAVKLDRGGSIVEAARSIELKVGASSIRLEPQGITIKGDRITVDGTAETQISAATTTVSGEGTLVLKGGLVKLN